MITVLDPINTLIIIRGVSGGGKSTLADLIAKHTNVAADDYFDIYNGGKFNPSYLRDAHSWCFSQVKDWMQQEEEIIAVHNTFTREWEFEDYIKLAKQNGYRVHSIIVENRHDGKSVHGVPDETIQKMKDRFEVKL
jgi:adenylate kinase family enzyme